MYSFLLALQFLTRIPVSSNFTATDQQLSYSVLYYPLIGLLLGALLFLLANLTQNSSALLTAAVLLAAWEMLTGGLHLDGLADCADAWAGGLGDRNRSFKILKDSASGPIAVSTLTLVLLLKWAAIAALLEQHLLKPLLIAPLLGRSAILGLMLSTPYVSLHGLAEKLLQHLPKIATCWVIGLSLVLSIWLCGFLQLILVILLLLWIRHTAIVRLAGVTGDVYGAAVELVETFFLVASAL